eukprot:3935113-Rhodomonas_salina.5
MWRCRKSTQPPPHVFVPPAESGRRAPDLETILPSTTALAGRRRLPRYGRAAGEYARRLPNSPSILSVEVGSKAVKLEAG